MALEDFTTYTEDDTPAVVTVTANKVAVASMAREDASWVYDDKGASHFGATFEHDFEFVGGAAGLIEQGTWAVSNLITGGTSDWDVNNRQALGLVWRGNGDEGRLKGYEDNDEDETINGSLPDDSTRRYLTVERTSETSATCSVYSDSGRSTLVDSVTVAVTSGRRFQYVFALVPQNNATGRTSSWDVENLDLKEAAAGLSIPIVMHHYKQMMGVN